MVCKQDLCICVCRLLHGILVNIETDQYPAYFGSRITYLEPDVVPFFGEPRRIKPVKSTEEILNTCDTFLGHQQRKRVQL